MTPSIRNTGAEALATGVSAPGRMIVSLIGGPSTSHLLNRRLPLSIDANEHATSAEELMGARISRCQALLIISEYDL